MTDWNPRRPGPEVPDGEPSDRVSVATPSDNEDSGRTFALAAARTLSDYRCEDVLVLDVRGLSEVADYLVLATGTSDRQLKSASRYLGELAKEHDIERLGSDRDEASTWVVLDYVETIVHLFEPTTRAHYDLEMLWGDAPQLDWRGE